MQTGITSQQVIVGILSVKIFSQENGFSSFEEVQKSVLDIAMFIFLILGGLALLVGFMFLIYLLRNVVAIGLKDLDATLVKSSVFGPIYENWFRKQTYYRQDTRIMYLDTVNAVVKAKVEETTGANGIKLIRYMENCPILSELYKPNAVQLPTGAS